MRFDYDLFLHKENMPPVNHTRVEMLTFTNPAEDFKKRLIKAGGSILKIFHAFLISVEMLLVSHCHNLS